jgi:hypothetical protein
MSIESTRFVTFGEYFDSVSQIDEEDIFIQDGDLQLLAITIGAFSSIPSFADANVINLVLSAFHNYFSGSFSLRFRQRHSFQSLVSDPMSDVPCR